ncbi:gamma-glutamyl-gamma-aminobutyrate hydrolase family protein [Psychroflexus sp. CAK57W]|uniref:gamma-glutamyl-gamma-aminobutyrate hydrolase family protein n=1 Tax=Psychroflexus curvus TaxID=2873595 RepID=UPI001CCD3D57|nr:gamma-glutamyl-gamma-aminobutyrate hydrolase family protein [Psychroflexus curvus]MBZ9786731.1 gamma-glutamyl-gamma-aminobutyrate hydrolase family protein [Psychroflexus curvus]
MSNLIIAVSMRETQASAYKEVRDTIARDWPEYLNKVFYDAKWLFVPNIKEDVIEYLNQWQVNGLILSGGDDLGDCPDRDATEHIMFNYALEKEWPVLGVCRGMQAIYTWLGGRVILSNDEFIKYHVAKNHDIFFQGNRYSVNSYHRLMLDSKTCPKNLDAIGICVQDNTIEAYLGNNILGLMWHPERESKPKEWEISFIRNFFKIEEK